MKPKNRMRLKKPCREDLIKGIFELARLTRDEKNRVYYFSIKNLMELVLILECYQSKLRKEQNNVAEI